MARTIGSIVAGIIAAFVLVLAVEMIGLSLFTQPAEMDPTNPESVRQHLSEIPTGSFLTVLVAWTLAAFAGPVVTRRLRGDVPRWPALTAAAIFAAGCAYNLAVIPMPIWMLPSAVVLVIVASWFGLTARVLRRS